MQQLMVYIYKGLRKIRRIILTGFHKIITQFIFYCNNVKVHSFTTSGIPYIIVARGGKCSIGENFRMNNNISSNPIGRTQKCIMAVDIKAEITIGNNVGISFTAINCRKSIIIKDNVTIGGGTCIYDSDFHPLRSADRIAENNEKTSKAPVVIEEDVFIGASATILKGVTIGARSIIGACSVVTKSIPSGEIWAGNPAKFIKKID